MGKNTKPLSMTGQQRSQLEMWVRGKTTAQRVAFRSQICLLAADGLTSSEIASRIKTSRPTVMLWKKRFDELGPEGLAQDAPRGPSPRRLDVATREAIVDTTMNVAPPEGNHWTTRTLAKALGISNATVARVWKACGIKRQAKKGGKRSKERALQQQRSSDVVGVFFHPPARAVAFGVVHGTSSRDLSQLWDRPQSGELAGHFTFPLDPKGCGSCLSAAISLLNNMTAEVSGGKIVFEGLLSFLENLDIRMTSKMEIQVLVEDPGSQSLSLVDQWVQRHKHVRMQFVPPGSLTGKNFQAVLDHMMTQGNLRVSSHSAAAIVEEIDRYIRMRTGGSLPFVWTGSPVPSDNETHMCKVVSESITRLGSLMAAVLHVSSEFLRNIYDQVEDPMNFKEKLESWFTATAFAEAGEHKTAMEIASAPIPQPRESEAPLSSLSLTFAAAAFAEENCHAMAAEILVGKRVSNSFLQTIGLTGVRVWSGWASAEQSFAEAVGLVGVRFRVVSIRL